MSKVRFCGILIVCIWILAGCSLSSQERVKLRDLDFTVLGEEKIPEQLKTIIEDILPAHLGIEYDFWFLIWRELEDNFPSWRAIEDLELSWTQLETFVEYL